MKFRSKASFSLIDPGSYQVALIGLVDIGTQDSDFGPKPKVRFTFEPLGEETDDGHPYAINAEFTVSLHPKSRLRPIVETLLGRKVTDAEVRDGFDAKQLLLTTCLAEVEHVEKADRTFAAIKSFSRVPKSMKISKPVMRPFFLSLDRDAFEQEVFDGLNERLRARIMASPEWAELTAAPSNRDDKGGQGGQGSLSNDLDDEVPF